MDLSKILELAIAALGVAVALGTLIKAYLEFVKQGEQRRAELFFALRARLREPHLAAISELIDQAHSGTGAESRDAVEQLERVPFRNKRQYVDLFEEVALLMNERQIQPQLAHYMFGYYALRCEECTSFWSNVNYQSAYWSVFREFCRQMRPYRARLEERHADLDAEVQPGVGLPRHAKGRVSGTQVEIKIPPVLRVRTGGHPTISVVVENASVEEALAQLFQMYPSMQDQILGGDGDLNRYVNVYANAQDVRFQDGLGTVVEDGEIVIMPAASGG